LFFWKLSPLFLNGKMLFMPELPEVETIVRDLKKKIIGRTIKAAWFDAPKLIKPSAKNLQKIKGLKIEDIKRRAKNILIYLSDKKLLLIHQKLTGHLLYGKWKIKKIQNSKFKVQSLLKGPLEEDVNNYIHLIFYLDNGWQMALSDLRKFAKILFGSQEEIENLEEIKKLGPEPLEKSFDFKKFKEVITRKSGKIKQVLMDQNVIAGIGNIYSDEILWEAKIHPFRAVKSLSEDDLKKIFLSLKKILSEALRLRGTSVSDYRDPAGKKGYYEVRRRVYQREGEKCRRCSALIKRVKIAGRSAHFCPKCQKI